MLKAPLPANEDARIKDLQSFEILDTEKEEDYEGLVDLASQVCQCPFAIVNFIDTNRQWFKASRNMEEQEADRENSFCGHAIMKNDVFIINDATKDERFADNPNVTDGMKVRFYAGAPIISPNGYNLGTVCVFDDKPKKLTASQVESLRTVASQVSRLLDLRKKNKLILQTATSMVSNQKKVAQMNMSGQDAQDYQTVLVLNNEINHAINTVKQQVEKARKDKTNSQDYLEASVDELDCLSESLSMLSKRLAPPVFNSENYRSLIEQFVKDFEQKQNANVGLMFNGHPGILRQEKGLMVFRIIQDLFRLAGCSGSRNVNLTIKGNGSFDIVFDYDTQKLVPESQRVLLQDNIFNRVEILGGHYDRSRFEANETRIQIGIPGEVN